MSNTTFYLLRRDLDPLVSDELDRLMKLTELKKLKREQTRVTLRQNKSSFSARDRGRRSINSKASKSIAVNRCRFGEKL